MGLVRQIRKQSAVPEASHTKTQQLLDFLQQSGKIQWNSDGKLVVDGAVSDGTNIHQLATYALQKSNSAPPKYYDEFYRILQNAEIPNSIINIKPALRFGEVPTNAAEIIGKTPTPKKKKLKKHPAPSPGNFSQKRYWMRLRH